LKKILVVLGTRPEVIKLAPIVTKLRENKAFEVKICNTEQHKDLTKQMLGIFGLHADFELDAMKPNQSPTDVLVESINGINRVLNNFIPDLVLVQGDTMSTLAGAIAGKYAKIKIAHLEAGLRTNDWLNPFPEEINRKLVAVLTDIHFAPTARSMRNLISEGINEKSIRIVGNSAIDALKITLKPYLEEEKSHLDTLISENILDTLQGNRRIVVNKRIVFFTMHRRESFGNIMQDAFRALIDLCNLFPDTTFVFPVHPNPNVRSLIQDVLKSTDQQVNNLILLKPLDYVTSLRLLNASSLLLTDSGGMQEEAPFLKVPTLVLREHTERIEAVESGACKLIGTGYESILFTARELLTDENLLLQMQIDENPYGDGSTSEKVLEVLKLEV
jgi:UDP-N-acetylglucosamine 2-epimerase (non-hydrolysing)